MGKRQHGFTIVELLIVIVVIAILAVLTIVAYNGINDRAQAAQIATGAKSIEKAFKLWLTERGDSHWPSDQTDYTAATPALPTYLPALCGTSTNNPSITSIITSCPNFGNYLQSAPTVNLPSAWLYDMDNDAKGATSTVANLSMGVNLCIDTVPISIARTLDSSIDDGNSLTGKVRFDNSLTTPRVYYSLSYVQAFN